MIETKNSGPKNWAELEASKGSTKSTISPESFSIFRSSLFAISSVKISTFTPMSLRTGEMMPGVLKYSLAFLIFELMKAIYFGMLLPGGATSMNPHLSN